MIFLPYYIWAQNFKLSRPSGWRCFPQNNKHLSRAITREQEKKSDRRTDNISRLAKMSKQHRIANFNVIISTKESTKRELKRTSKPGNLTIKAIPDVMSCINTCQNVYITLPDQPKKMQKQNTTFVRKKSRVPKKLTNGWNVINQKKWLLQMWGTTSEKQECRSKNKHVTNATNCHKCKKCFEQRKIEVKTKPLYFKDQEEWSSHENKWYDYIHNVNETNNTTQPIKMRVTPFFTVTLHANGDPIEVMVHTGSPFT